MALDLSEDLLAHILDDCKKAGADAAEVALSERRSLSIQVRQGALEEVESEETRDLGVRVFFGRKSATVTSSDLSESTRQRLIERVCAMARLAPDNPYASLADKELLETGHPRDLDLYDPTEKSPAALEALALEAETAALAIKRVTTSNGASASVSHGSWRLLTTDGFSGHHEGSGFSLGVSVIATHEDGSMERGGEGRSVRHMADLPGAARLGQVAGERASARLGARKIDSGTYPVIFENLAAGGLIGPLLGAMSGTAIARGASFLLGKMGDALLPDAISLIDDPFRVRGLGSTPYDDEGVRVEKRALIERGRLTTWLLNTAAAAQLGLLSTGHASRGLVGPSGVGAHNVTLEGGQGALQDLMTEARSGLFVTSMFGPSLNENTGDWSTGVSGFWFENGQIAYPVNEVTVAGNLLDLYRHLVVANDAEIRGTRDYPSILVPTMTVGGK